MPSQSRRRYFGAVSNGKSSDDLSRRPFCSRVCCHIKVYQSAAIKLDDDKDEQNLKERRRNREEVDGDELFRVILEERLPRLRRRLRCWTMYLLIVDCESLIPS